MGWALCALPIVRVPPAAVVDTSQSVPKRPRSGPASIKRPRVVMESAYKIALESVGWRQLPKDEVQRGLDFKDRVETACKLAVEERARLEQNGATATRLKSAEPERAIKTMVDAYNQTVKAYNTNLPAVIPLARKPTPYPKQSKGNDAPTADEFTKWATFALAPPPAATTKAKASRLRASAEVRAAAVATERAAREQTERRPAVVAGAKQAIAAARAQLALPSSSSQSATTSEAHRELWYGVQRSVTAVSSLGAREDAVLIGQLETAANDLARAVGTTSSEWVVPTASQSRDTLSAACKKQQEASMLSSRRHRAKQKLSGTLEGLQAYSATSLIGTWDEKANKFTLRLAGMTVPSRETAEGICAMMGEPPPGPYTFDVVEDSSDNLLMQYHLGGRPEGSAIRHPRASAAPTDPSAPTAGVPVASPPTIVEILTEGARDLQVSVCEWFGWK
jgi:hypothetical protein